MIVCVCLFVCLFVCLLACLSVCFLAFLLSCLFAWTLSRALACICSQEGHTTSTEPEVPAVDLDLETVTDSVKDYGCHGCHGCLAESWSEKTRTVSERLGKIYEHVVIVPAFRMGTVRKNHQIVLKHCCYICYCACLLACYAAVPIFQDSPDAGLTPQTGVEFPTHAENKEAVKSVEKPTRSEEAS